MLSKMKASSTKVIYTCFAKHLSETELKKKIQHTFLLHCTFADALFSVFIPVASSISEKSNKIIKLKRRGVSKHTVNLISIP